MISPKIKIKHKQMYKKLKMIKCKINKMILNKPKKKKEECYKKIIQEQILLLGIVDNLCQWKAYVQTNKLKKN